MSKKDDYFEQLKDDPKASKMFTGKPRELEKNPKWTVNKKNID
jgi:hypothetical protein